ncbi:MAG: phosphatase PAP2 family protein [Planctomycetota bacterium]
MSYYTPIQRRLRLGSTLRGLGLAALAFLVAVVLDRPLYWLLRSRLNIQKPDVDGADWWEFMRVFGYLPAWFFLALPIWLHDRQQAASGATQVRPRRRMGLILLSVIFAGALAELLKPILGRTRPDATEPTFGLLPNYKFFPMFAETPDGVGLGLASSHTAIAFGGAWATALVVPSARAAVLVGAFGCAVSRILAHAHYLSDCVLAAIIGIAIARLLFESDQQGRRPNESLVHVRRRLG